ncbi:MAG: c-type cytochrome [Sphingomonas sp.]
MQSHSVKRFSIVAFGVALSVFALSACSQANKAKEDAQAAADSMAATASNAADSAGNMVADAGNAAADVGAMASNAAGAAVATVKGAVAAANTDTLSGAKYATFTGDAASGEKIFVACKTCHAFDKNAIGPMLKGIVGRSAGTVATYSYSAANKNSGITWTPEKLFQYLEKPQRVVPGTKMSYPGLPDPQKRADVIAYLKSNS